MTLNELICELEDLRDSGYGETEVKMNIQASYPLESDNVTITGYNGHEKDGDGNDNDEKSDEACVYIACGECYDYGNEYAWSGNIDDLDEDDYTEYEED